jgi:hypothetical protein
MCAATVDTGKTQKLADMGRDPRFRPGTCVSVRIGSTGDVNKSAAPILDTHCVVISSQRPYPSKSVILTLTTVTTFK